MKSTPILFNGEMVRAILDGRKTQTRRIIREVPMDHIHLGRSIMDWALSGVYEENGKFWLDVQTEVDDNSHQEIQCPYGGLGDTIIGKETYGFCSDGGNDLHLRFPADNSCAEIRGCHMEWAQKAFRKVGSKLRPSIFLPIWASRIIRTLTAVRVERLHDITEEDAMAEGVEETFTRAEDSDAKPVMIHKTAIHHYCNLWDSINAKKHPWTSNPWVWVLEWRNP